MVSAVQFIVYSSRCIVVIAYDILYDPKTRAAFDSVDPTFDDTIPPKEKENFFEIFGPVFQRNTRLVLYIP